MNDTKQNEIRPYGPGKFNTILDSYIYQVSLDGCLDEEIGDASESGWYGLMRTTDFDFASYDLNDAELSELHASVGVIISENSQGFVYVDYYTTDKELNDEWDAIVAEFDEQEEEN